MAGAAAVLGSAAPGALLEGWSSIFPTPHSASFPSWHLTASEMVALHVLGALSSSRMGGRAGTSCPLEQQRPRVVALFNEQMSCHW